MKKRLSKRRRKSATVVPGSVEKSQRALLLALRNRALELDLSVAPSIIARAQRVRRPAPLTKNWSIEEKQSILDYLHGEIAGEEVKACCYYEYARASETIRKARREYDPSRLISDYFPPWVLNPLRFCFLQCPNFFGLAWRDLSKQEREHIRLLFKPVSPRPIITDVRALNALRIFDQFKQQAEQKPLGGHCPAIVGDDAIKHAVITVDFRDGVDVVAEQFAHWLATKANRKLFKEYYKEPMHKQNPHSPARYKELLKFLAAWRLYDEFKGFTGAAKWTSENRRRKDFHPQKFFREKLRQTPTGKHYKGPLFKEPRQWEAAIARAKSFLANEIEFGQSADVGSR
jgi:hypothetical protein